MKTSGIYQIKSKLHPERNYIGSALNIAERRANHLKLLRKNKHANSKLQNHFNKYGEDDLTFIVIEPCLPDFLLIREQFYLDNLNPFFNICKTAGSLLGVRRTPESRKRQSELYRGENHPMFGRRHTEESKMSMSESRKGCKAWNKGKKMSMEICKANSESHKGIKLSEITKKKMSEARTGIKNPMYGKKQSEESNRKNRESQLGKIHSPHTLESRLKMSIAKKESWRIKKLAL